MNKVVSSKPQAVSAERGARGDVAGDSDGMEPLMTTAEVAQYANVHKNTVSQWVNRKRNPLVYKTTIGRSYRFERKVVERFLEQQAHKVLGPREIAEIKQQATEGAK